jgi:FKBP-type peptidyl-prolyl cis-trans isomerase
MGRRKRSHHEDYDDSLERQFWKEHTTPTNANSKSDCRENHEDGDDKKTNKDSSSDHNNSEENQQKIVEQDNDSTIIRQREKKRIKKLRQKEKKLLEKNKIQEQQAVQRQHQEDIHHQRLVEKKRKEIEKKTPSSEEFVQTHKGVKYCDIQVGTGPMIQDRKKVRVKYILRAKNKNGKILDSGGNFSFRMGKGEVISGWEIGLLRMRQGGVRHILVPPKAGYGSKDIGGGPGADLYFEVTLLQC